MDSRTASFGIIVLAASAACVAFGFGPSAVAGQQGAHEAGAGTGADVTIANFVGRIERQTTDGPVRVSVQPGAAAFNPLIKGTNVRGPSRLSQFSCETRNGEPAQIRFGGRSYQASDLPVLRISGPARLKVSISGSAVHGDLGRIGSSTIGTVSCGDLTIGAVDGKLEINAAGSGAVRTGDVSGDLEANVAGSGALIAGAIRGAAQINLAGSGDARLASAGGALQVNVAGSGDVQIAGGDNRLDVNIAGSGNVTHSGTARNPEVSIIGSGNVTLARVSGRQQVSRMGTGRVVILQPGAR
jgi:hypothetical protein